VPSGNTITVLSSHTLAATCGLFPPPLGRQLLTTSLDSTLILWEISSSTPIFKSSIFSPPNNPEQDPAESGITSLAIAPNGQICAVGSAHGLVKVVGLEKGNVVATLKGHGYGESVEALKFVDLLNGAGGGKGVVLVSGGTDGKGFVWDVTTGRVRAELTHDVSVLSRSSSSSSPSASYPFTCFCHTLRTMCMWRNANLTNGNKLTTGTNNFSRTPLFPKSPPSHLGLGRRYAENLGYPYRCLDSHAQRSRRSCERRRGWSGPRRK